MINPDAGEDEALKLTIVPIYNEHADAFKPAKGALEHYVVFSVARVDQASYKKGRVDNQGTQKSALAKLLTGMSNMNVG